MAGGQIGSQALKLGPLPLENPATIVRGDRVTHLVYDVIRDGR